MQPTHEEVFEWFSLHLTKQQLDDLNDIMNKVEQRFTQERSKLQRNLTPEEMFILWLMER